MAYFYTLPKLHKSTRINGLPDNSSEYSYLPDYDEIIEGRPIVGGPCYYPSGLSEMVDIILQPILTYIPYILKDSFDLIERCDKNVQGNVLFGSSDIKSLYTNLSHELIYKSIEYWVNKYDNEIQLLQRYKLHFII